MTKNRTDIEVLTVDETRSILYGIARNLDEQGPEADPVVFGPHRKPAGVIVSWQRWRQLAGLRDAG